MPLDNLYDILKVDRKASLDEIKKAYKKGCLILHPDRPTGNIEKFKELNFAYETLIDSDKRKLYDRYGIKGLDQTKQFQHPISVPDIQHIVNLSLYDIYIGKRITINYMRDELCHTCDGNGSKSGKSYNCVKCDGNGIVLMVIRNGPFIQQMQSLCDKCSGTGNTIKDEDKCSTCNGNKVIKMNNSFEFDLPKGIPSASKIAIEHEGNYCPKSHLCSNLVIVVNTVNDNVFERCDNQVDLKMKIELDLFDSLYGTTVQFKHLNNDLIEFYAKNIKHKDLKIIKNKGIPKGTNYNEFGNLIIEFHINYPSNEFLDKHKDLFKKEFGLNDKLNDDIIRVELSDYKEIKENGRHGLGNDEFVGQQCTTQ